MNLRVGIVMGTTRVNPNAYGGWDGECPGCDLDAKRICDISMDKGVESVWYQNEEVTKAAFSKLFKFMASITNSDDLFFIYYSGHGGQMPDQNGDEIDGKDETFCFYDGEFVDDDMYQLLSLIDKEVRCFVITDCCNSGSNLRARQLSTPRSIEKAIPEEFCGKVIHFAGCGDGRYSYGSEDGGVFTNALIRSFSPEITYQEWFDRTKQLMPRNQKPVYTEYGNVTNRFRNTLVFY